MSARKAWSPDHLLALSGRAWFATAALGLMAFALYALVFFVPPTVMGDFAQWDRNTRMEYGYIEGDSAGNAQFAAHVMVAGTMTLAGLLQMIPALRRRYPKVHRWTGRVFLLTAVIGAATGLLMKWFRAPVVVDVQNLAISFNAVLILLMAWLTLHFALKRDFARHQRWAMRLWLVASGVWFIRVGILAWGLLHTALTGGDGPFAPDFMVVSFISYLVPWAVYEAYQLAARMGTDTAKLAMAGVMMVCAALTLVGVGGASMVFWLPLLLPA
jgi:Predicted membrane protein (DUF2306)